MCFSLKQSLYIRIRKVHSFKRVLDPLGFVFTKERDNSQAAAIRPAWLSEELEEYNYIVHLCEIIEGDVRLLIYRK